MKRFKVLFLAIVVLSMAVPAFATDLVTDKSLRVYNVMPDTSSFWDINKIKLADGNATFPIQQFVSKTSGSFAVYVLANYNGKNPLNVGLAEKTLDASFTWTQGTYETRGACPGAYVRFEFQDVTAGPYDSNDYWWSTGTDAPLAVNLNTATYGELSASLDDRALWTNQAGKSALDTTENWTDWTGSIVALSPFDGFTKAVANVKQIGLSFGSSCGYASGVALNGGTGTFTLQDYNINP